MTFTMQNLVGERVLVKGTDQFGTDGQTVLDSSQWTEVNSHKEFDQATEAFDEAVKEFFAPLQDAVDKVEAARKGPEPDSIGFVVLSEAQEGRPSKAAHLVKLTHDSTVLRLLEAGQSDRLAWVNETLEILEAPAPATTATVVDESEIVSG